MEDIIRKPSLDEILTQPGGDRFSHFETLYLTGFTSERLAAWRKRHNLPGDEKPGRGKRPLSHWYDVLFLVAARALSDAGISNQISLELAGKLFIVFFDWTEGKVGKMTPDEAAEFIDNEMPTWVAVVPAARDSPDLVLTNIAKYETAGEIANKFRSLGIAHVVLVDQVAVLVHLLRRLEHIMDSRATQINQLRKPAG